MTARTDPASSPFLTVSDHSSSPTILQEQKKHSWPRQPSISGTHVFLNCPGTCDSTDSTAWRSTAASGSSDGMTQYSSTPGELVTVGSRVPSRPPSAPTALRVGRHVFVQHGSVDRRTSGSSTTFPTPPSSRPTQSTKTDAKLPRATVTTQWGAPPRSVVPRAPRMPLGSRTTPQVVVTARTSLHRGVANAPFQPRSSAAEGLRSRLRARVDALRQNSCPLAAANAALLESPHAFLRFLGSATVNDAPLPSFLPRATLAGADVHLVCADAGRFAVQCASDTIAASTWVRTLLPAHSPGRQGVTLVLTALDDHVRSLLRPAPLPPPPSPPTPPPPPAPHSDIRTDYVPDTYGVPMWDRGDDELCLTPPSVPASNMSVVNQELHRHYSTALDSDMLGAATPTVLYPPPSVEPAPTHTLPPHEAPSLSGTAGLKLDHSETIAAVTSLSQPSLPAAAAVVVEGWKRYSSVAALNVALATVGGCSPRSLPFLSVQLVSQRALLTEAVRMEMHLTSAIGGASGAASLALRQSKLAQRVGSVTVDEDWLPVAVELPMPRKGTLNGTTAFGRPPSMQSEPFADAEVFQLLYLQLVFRKFFDVRFPHLVESSASVDGENSTWWTRTDYVGVGDRVEQGIAFEHPTDPTRCLFFPPFTRLVALLGLEQAVIPMYATPDLLQKTSRLPLAGSSPDLLCTGRTGQNAARWAWLQDINSPRAATCALEGLFEQFEDAYGCTRQELECATAMSPPLVFRCGESTVGAGLQQQFADLSRFFVAPELRLPPSEAACDALGTSATALANTSFTPANRTETLPDVMATRSDEVVESASVFSVVNATPGSTSALAVLKGPDPMAATLSATIATPVLSGQLLPPSTPPGLAPLTRPLSPAPSAGQDSLAATVRAEDVLPMSPFTKQESVVTRWRHYIQTGLISIFDGLTDGIELQGFIGKGGSGLVYKGVYGRRRLPVAVKVFVIPDGMTHEDYVRESLTDVAFYVLLNQLDDFAICNAGRAHDFIVSAVAPKGLPDADAETARRGNDAATTRLCYLVTDLMDGTIGRFVTEDEDDYDPSYDTLVNSPLRDIELFQFLFLQLACKSLFDWRVLDLMLNGQLRGDNLGYRHAHPTDTVENKARTAYDGFLVAYQTSPEAEVRYLRFPMVATRGSGDESSAVQGVDGEPQRFIFFIDLGQGMQPNVQELTKNTFIGETVVESCVQEDGFGRYWPLDELYCRYVEVVGDHARNVLEWGSRVRINSQEDAVAALAELFDLYAPMYGCDAPSAEERSGFLQLTWSPTSVAELKKAYVYRPGV